MWNQLVEYYPDLPLPFVEVVDSVNDLDPQEVDGSKDGDDSENA